MKFEHRLRRGATAGDPGNLIEDFIVTGEKLAGDYSSRRVKAALTVHDGNRALAARRLRLGVGDLRKLIDHYDLGHYQG